jgi:hypothetical protein
MFTVPVTVNPSKGFEIAIVGAVLSSGALPSPFKPTLESSIGPLDPSCPPAMKFSPYSVLLSGVDMVINPV